MSEKADVKAQAIAIDVPDKGQGTQNKGLTRDFLKKNFLDIPVAAELAGYSVRHFRRVAEENHIPIIRIGRKFFIKGVDVEAYKASRKSENSSKAKEKINFSETITIPEKDTLSFEAIFPSHLETHPGILPFRPLAPFRNEAPGISGNGYRRVSKAAREIAEVYLAIERRHDFSPTPVIPDSED